MWGNKSFIFCFLFCNLLKGERGLNLEFPYMNYTYYFNLVGFYCSSNLSDFLDTLYLTITSYSLFKKSLVFIRLNEEAHGGVDVLARSGRKSHLDSFKNLPPNA